MPKRRESLDGTDSRITGADTVAHEEVGGERATYSKSAPKRPRFRPTHHLSESRTPHFSLHKPMLRLAPMPTTGYTHPDLPRRTTLLQDFTADFSLANESPSLSWGFGEFAVAALRDIQTIGCPAAATKPNRVVSITFPYDFRVDTNTEEGAERMVVSPNTSARGGQIEPLGWFSVWSLAKWLHKSRRISGDEPHQHPNSHPQHLRQDGSRFVFVSSPSSDLNVEAVETPAGRAHFHCRVSMRGVWPVHRTRPVLKRLISGISHRASRNDQRRLPSPSLIMTTIPRTTDLKLREVRTQRKNGVFTSKSANIPVSSEEPLPIFPRIVNEGSVQSLNFPQDHLILYQNNTGTALMATEKEKSKSLRTHMLT